MNFPLAVFSPNINSFSETFIRRHMQDLLPGRTAVITKNLLEGSTATNWGIQPPLLVLGGARIGLKRQVFDAVAWQLGYRPEERSTRAIKTFLREHGVKVLLAQYLDEALPYLEIARELGIRFYAQDHGYDVSERLLDPYWRTAYLKLNDADGLFSRAAYCRERLVEAGLRAEKITVIIGGVDVPESCPEHRTGSEVNCIAVGSMVSKKAPIYLLESFRRARQQDPSLTLDYVGGGPLMPAAIHYVHAHGLESAVRLHGRRDSAFVMEKMRRADLFLQHSVVDPISGAEEGVPTAIKEAMAMALPVVSTRHAGIPEVVAEGETGFLVEEGDCSAMADRILCLAGEAAKRERLGKAGWCRARHSFTWRHERERLLEGMGLA